MKPGRLGALGALEAPLEALDLAGGVEDHLLAREERVAAVADVDAQLAAVEPTWKVVLHEAQSTVACWYFGWIFGFMCSPGAFRTVSRRWSSDMRSAGAGRRTCPAGYSPARASTLIRFLVRVSCS